MNKSKLHFFIDMFSKLTAAIFLFSSVYIFCFNGFNVVLNVAYIWGVLAIALVLTLAYLPFLNDLSKKAFIIWQIAYALFANASVFGIGLILHWVSFALPSSVAGMEIVFLIVYAVVYLVMWITNRRNATVLNEKLKAVQKL